MLFEVSREDVVVSMILQREVGSFVKWRLLSPTLVKSSAIIFLIFWRVNFISNDFFELSIVLYIAGRSINNMYINK